MMNDYPEVFLGIILIKKVNERYEFSMVVYKKK